MPRIKRRIPTSRFVKGRRGVWNSIPSRMGNTSIIPKNGPRRSTKGCKQKCSKFYKSHSNTSTTVRILPLLLRLRRRILLIIRRRRSLVVIRSTNTIPHLGIPPDGPCTSPISGIQSPVPSRIINTINGGIVRNNCYTSATSTPNNHHLRQTTSPFDQQRPIKNSRSKPSFMKKP